VLMGGAYLSYNGEKHPQDLLAYIAGGALGGALYGGLIGAAIGTESWTTVYPATTAASLPPRQSPRSRVGVSLPF
jgi:hypothetical protein